MKVSTERVTQWVIFALKESPATLPLAYLKVKALATADDESVSLTTLKGVLAELQLKGTIHRIALPKTEATYHFGPKPPAPEPTPDAKQAADAEAYGEALADGGFSPFDVRWTKLEDLEAQGRQQNSLSGVHVADDATTYAITALKQTIICSPDGMSFVALPVTSGAGREYIGVAPSVLERTVRRDVKIVPGVWSPWLPRTDPDKPKRKKDFQQILNEISVPVSGWVYDGQTPASFIDGDGLFHRATWNVLPIEPVFDEDCDAYLRTWGSENYVRLCDWIVHLQNRHQPAPMLVAQGDKGSAKDTLADALARQYRRNEGAVSADIAVDGFNADIAACPVVRASEKLPTDAKGGPMSTATFREMITRSAHDINQKNMPRVKLLGYLRWILTTNEADFYPTREKLSGDSLEAIAGRLLVIEAPRLADGRTAPHAHLADRGGMKHTGEWLNGEGRLVKHVRWIMQNHKIQYPCPEGRFGVAPHAPEFRDRLAASSTLGSLVVDGLARFLVGDPTRRELRSAVRVGDGVVLVHVDSLFQRWRNLVGLGSLADKLDARRATPLPKPFIDEIERLSHPEVASDNGRTYRSIRVPLLLAHAQAVGFDAEELAAKLELPEAEFSTWQASRVVRAA